MREVAELLAAWNSFYVIIGSAAAALTGLMFVVITLARTDDGHASETAVSVFNTPTIVHFSCALFTAALMSVPFRSFVPIAIILGLAGVAGVVHVALTARLTSKLENYRPDAEDWTWHVLLPFVAYATLSIGAIALPAAPAHALYAPAAAITLLVFIGIHNAWDVVTFLATGQAEALPDKPVENAPATQESE